MDVNTNGNGSQPPQPEEKDLACLVLRYKVRDIYGSTTDRFREGGKANTAWRLRHDRAEAQETVVMQKPVSAIEASVLKGPAPLQQVQQTVPIYELCWEIRQELGDRMRMIVVPYADAHRELPLEIVEFHGIISVPMPDGSTRRMGTADDSKLTREAMPPAIAVHVRQELARRAKLVRGEETVQ